MKNKKKFVKRNVEEMKEENNYCGNQESITSQDDFDFFFVIFVQAQGLFYNDMVLFCF